MVMASRLCFAIVVSRWSSFATCCLTSLRFSLILISVRSPRHHRGEAVCPHPRLTSQVVDHSPDSSSSSPENSARSAARTRARSSPGSAARTADDVNAKTTMLVVGARDSVRRRRHSGRDRRTSARPRQEQQAEARRGAERAARQRPPIRILTEEEFCRLAGVPTPETLKQQYHALRDLLARYRVAARGSPALSGEVRRHPAGAAHQRRHLLRVSGSRGHQAGERRARAGRVVPQRRAHAARRRARASSRSTSGSTPRRRRSSTLRRAGSAAGDAAIRRRRAARHRAAPRSTSAPARRSTTATSRRRTRRRRPTARRSSSIRIWSPR